MDRVRVIKPDLPICAISTARPTWRMKVDLPPMLGPVMMWNQDCGGQQGRRGAQRVAEQAVHVGNAKNALLWMPAAH